MIMPWFKHYNNASSSLSIQKMMRKLGVAGYGQYFLLLEICCSKFDGTDFIIDLSLTELAVKLKIKPSRVQVILKSFQESNLLRFTSDDFIFKIELPILLELQGKDFKHNRKRIAKESQKATLDIEIDKDIDKEEDKDKEINKEIEIVKSDFDYTHPLEIKCEPIKFNIELIYAEYPRKEGKKIGMERLKKIIKSQEKFDQVLLAVKNYKKSTYGTEMKYIKQFSSFVSVWEDYLNTQEEKPSIIEESRSRNPFLKGVVNDK